MMMFHSLVLFLTVSVPHASSQLQWKRPSSTGTGPDVRRDAAIGYHATTQTIVIFGGRPGPKADTWTYSIAAGTWTEVNSTMNPSARFSMVYGSSGDYFFIATGEGSGKFFDDIWKFNFNTRQWEELPAQQRPRYLDSVPDKWDVTSSRAYSPTHRYGAAGGVYPGSNNFYVSLGFADQRYFDTLSYDTSQGEEGWSLEFCPSDECHPYSPLYPHARCLHSATMIAEYELLLFGGCMTGGGTGGACPSGDLWKFDAHTKQWSEMKTCPSPSTYSSMAMLYPHMGKRRVVLYGGNEGGKQVIQTTESASNEVAVFNADTDEWTIREVRDDATGRPSKRMSAAMVTSEAGIYMFGGALSSSGEALNDLWLLEGNAQDADDSPAKDCPTKFVNWLMLHGIFMVAGWGCFLTWGAFIARFLKPIGKAWFIIHVVFQIFGYICAIIGFAFAVVSVQFDHFKFGHGVIGLIVMCLGFLQPINGFLRAHLPEEGEPKSWRRIIWEYAHHLIGRTAILLGLVNCSLGVFLAVASVPVWATWYGYLCFLFAAFVIAQLAQSIQRERRQRRRKGATFSSDMMFSNGSPRKDGIASSRM